MSAQVYFRTLYELAKRLYWEADEALYNHERPFYHYCATGFPSGERFTQFSQWERRRDQLEVEWRRRRRIMESLKERVFDEPPIPSR